MGKRLLVELYFSHITISVPLGFPCGSDNKKYTQCSATTAESTMGILSNAVQTEGNVYLNSAGKHLVTSFEGQRHGGAWNKQSSQHLFFFFCLRIRGAPFPPGAGFEFSTCPEGASPKVGKAQ